MSASCFLLVRICSAQGNGIVIPRGLHLPPANLPSTTATPNLLRVCSVQDPLRGPGRGSDSPPDCHSLPRLRFVYPCAKGGGIKSLILFRGDCHLEISPVTRPKTAPCRGRHFLVPTRKYPKNRLRGGAISVVYPPWAEIGRITPTPKRPPLNQLPPLRVS